MKTLDSICLLCNAGFKRLHVIILYGSLYALTQCIHIQAYAQDIEIKNPSLEGVARGSYVPSPWLRFEQSPDTQPEGCCGITQTASDGKTYVGTMGSAKWTERIAQHLVTPMKAGKTYTLSFDLAYPPVYFSSRICFSSLALYGADSLRDKGDELWQSVTFIHTEWKRYTAVFTPTKDYDYIVAGPYYDTTCNGIYTAVLIDNFSAYLREVPQITVYARNSCKDSNTGTAIVKVKNGMGPYTYYWQPGNYNDSTVSNLGKGTYEVTVISANGASATSHVQIGENDLEGKVILSSPICYKDSNAVIQLDVNGGVAPYTFSIDKGITFQTSPLFNKLDAGTYSIVIKDAYNCVLNIDDIVIDQPKLLMIASAHVNPVSCSDVQNGKIILSVTGGTPPYTYSIPGYTSQLDSVLRQLDAGQYYYRVTDSHDCSVEGDATITKEWRDCAVFMPNAFSPNGDGLNDVFRAKIHDDITDFRMSIYGRWGELVYQNSNADKGWDGTLKGVSVPGGSYVWVVTYIDSKQQAIKQQGTLVLMR
jgi:gliding motility-associated-like protein